MSELKPCPFCGNEPTVTNEFDDEVLFYGCTKDIDCPLYDAPFVNLENWNTRPIEDALNARIAELESLVEQLIWVGNDLLVSNTNPVTITLFNGLVCNAKEREK